MFLLPSILIGLAVAVAAGGDLRRLSTIPFRRTWLVALAFGVQLILFTRLGEELPRDLREAAHVATYGLLLAFGLVNRRIRAFAPILLGATLNAIVIAVNGGVMPVSRAAAESVGIDVSSAGNVSGEATRLVWFGDVFALPSALPFANAFSAGDVLIAVGAVWLIATACTVGVEARVLSARRFAAPLAHRGLARLVAGRLVSQVGDWLTVAAVVGWVYGRGSSTTAVALLLLARLAPPILGGGAAALVVDRLSIARLLPAIELVRGLVIAAAAVGAALDSLAVVFVAIALSGALAAVTGAASSATLPSLVPPSELTAANAALGMAKSLAMLMGAGSGALVLAYGSVTAALAIDVATFGIAALVLAHLRTPRSSALGAPAFSCPPPRGRLRYLAAHPQTALLILCFSVATFATGLTNASFPRYFESLGGAASSYGLAIAALAAGLVLGELFVAATPSGERRWIGLGLFAMGGLFAVLAMTEQAAMALLVVVAIGFVDGTTDVLFDTVLQETTEPSRRGLVFGASAATMATTMMAGVALAPVLAGLLTPAVVFGIVGAALGVAGAIGLVATARDRAPLAHASR